jgi:hypothetical protein
MQLFGGVEHGGIGKLKTLIHWFFLLTIKVDVV